MKFFYKRKRSLCQQWINKYCNIKIKKYSFWVLHKGVVLKRKYDVIWKYDKSDLVCIPFIILSPKKKEIDRSSTLYNFKGFFNSCNQTLQVLRFMAKSKINRNYFLLLVILFVHYLKNCFPSIKMIKPNQMIKKPLTASVWERVLKYDWILKEVESKSIKTERFTIFIGWKNSDKLQKSEQAQTKY